MRYIALLLLVLALAAFGFLHRTQAPHYSLATIERAETSEARERGLSGRSDIPLDYGMLFVFAEKGEYAFWMKDMLVSIDIIWLADDGTIIGIEHAVAPETYPESFHAPEPLRYVLETRAGTAEQKGWKSGTMLSLPLTR